jgi:type II secretory pathway pseudopilin PulG
MMAAMRKGSRSSRGFTLLEVGIGLVLLGLILGVALPSVNSLSGAELRKTTGLLQGLFRDTYSRAALSGNSHRIVFDMDNHGYWVEVTQGLAVMKRERQELGAEGAALLDVIDERIDGLEDSRDEEDVEKIRLYGGPTWQPIEGELGRPSQLHPDVRFFQIWVEYLEEGASAGQVAVHFFPGGYTQEAFISLTDDDSGDRTLTLVAAPLTGETYIEEEIPEVPFDD